MQLTVKEALELTNNRHVVRDVKMADLQTVTSEFGAILPFTLCDYFMNNLVAQSPLYGGELTEPTIRVSHVSITSVEGENVFLKPNGVGNEQDLLKGRKPDDIVNVTMKYDRLQLRTHIGPGTKYRDSVGFLYALDAKKFTVVAGKTVSICNNLNVFSDDFLFTSNTKDIGPAMLGLGRYLQAFEHYSTMGTRFMEVLGHTQVTKANIDMLIADNHLLSALNSAGIRKGTRQVFDDALLKQAHYLFYNTEHPYRLTQAKSQDEEVGTLGDVYNCFTEALGRHNRDLNNDYQKHLSVFKYFNTLTEQIAGQKLLA